MKKIALLFFVLMIGFQAQAQQYPLVTLKDINLVPDSLWPSFPPSPLVNDTVRVRGMVMMRPIVAASGDRRPIIWAGARWASYIQDNVNPVWGGLNIIQNDTTTAAQGTLLDLADTAKVYEFTGVVLPYFQSTQLSLITAPTPIPITPVASFPKRPDPVPLSLDSFWTAGNTYNYAMRKYQGVYVILKADEQHPLVTSDRVTGTGSASGNFKINDLSGHYCWNYAQSTYFKSNANGIIPGYQPPADGSFLSYVRGILTIRADAYYVVPMYPGDIGPVIQSPPTVSTVRRTPAIVAPSQAVTVSAIVKGVSSYVTKAQIFFKVNGGTLDSIAMTKSPSDSTSYSGIIPGRADSALVEYYVKATDANGLSVTNPANIVTNRYIFFVLNKPLAIQHVRYSPFGSGYSGYNGYPVTVSGVVISDTSDIPGNRSSNPPRVYIQNGSGQWSGILVGTAGANGTQVLSVKRGDNITVTGIVTLGSRGTRIDTLTSLVINSHNNPMPTPTILTTGTVGTNPLGTLTVEPYSGTLVTYKNLTVDSANADGNSNFGECYMNDGTVHTRVIWSDGNTTYHNGLGPASFTLVKKGDKFTSITGVLGYTHSQFKLCPRKNDDVLGYTAEVKMISEGTPSDFELAQNYPNPFNPSTAITYSIPKAGFVHLKIYDALGREVRTLVSESQIAGTYSVEFNAGALPSGIYLYALTADGAAQVKKMMLVK